jgi:hypothetical protein
LSFLKEGRGATPRFQSGEELADGSESAEFSPDGTVVFLGTDESVDIEVEELEF